MSVAVAILSFMSVAIFLVFMAYYPKLDADRMRWLFNGLVNGLLSLVTIILTINQLILSRQFGSPEDLYERLEKRIQFRKEVEDSTGSVIASSLPGEFTNHLFQALRGSAVELQNVYERRDHSDRLSKILDQYTNTIFGQTDRVLDTLQSEPFEMTGVLELLSYDDSWQFYTTRRLQLIHHEELSDREREILEDIREILKQIDTARQYFETLYLQRELAQLSRQVVYVGILSIIVASSVIMVYKNDWNVTLSYPWYAVILSVTFGLTIFPVAILFSHALRLATVTRRTVVFGPFTPQEEQQTDSDWNA